MKYMEQIWENSIYLKRENTFFYKKGKYSMECRFYSNIQKYKEKEKSLQKIANIDYIFNPLKHADKYILNNVCK